MFHVKQQLCFLHTYTNNYYSIKKQLFFITQPTFYIKKTKYYIHTIAVRLLATLLYIRFYKYTHENLILMQCFT